MSLRLHLILKLLLLTIIVEVYCLNLTQNYESVCDRVYTKRQFILESPQYPSNYPINLRCSYLIKGPTCPTYFTLQFLDFNLEESVGCAKDRLEISDVDAICGTRNTIKTYFSDKGTLLLRLLSDGDETGRGFRILVTRSPCNSQNPNPTNTPNEVEFTTKETKFVPSQYRRCCRDFYQDKYLVVASPNFPYSMATMNDCIFEIRKFNPYICRLRIHVQFFWMGETNQSCPAGYLQIDGKLVCGCKNDLKLISPFAEDSKIIRFVSRGTVTNSYSGFVLEIVQDECPKRYARTDQTNPFTSLEKLHLISENTEIIDDNNSQLHQQKSPQIFKHFYFFGEPFGWYPAHRDREETDYIDTSIDSVITNSDYNYDYCRHWNIGQFNYLSRQNFDRCATQQSTRAGNNCLILDYVRGYFKSPGYPFYYPGNLNICYRFKRLPGYCSIRIYMNDFDIENSLNCAKDSLVLQHFNRFCGNSLKHQGYYLDLADKPYEDLLFTTDALYCNRGFYATFEQLPCQNRTIPDITTTPPPKMSCQRTIQQRLFSFEISDSSGPSCVFTIRKYGPEVCRIQLYFEQFDLVCASESILIDGTMYCGQMSGRDVTIDMTQQQQTVIIYRRNAPVNGQRLRISGTQIIDDCYEPQVPAQRFLAIRPGNRSNHTKFMVKFTENFKDICGIITNSTQVDLPATFCDFIGSTDRNVTECLPLVGNSLVVPLESQRLQFDIKSVDKVKQIEFEVVDCDEMSNL